MPELIPAFDYRRELSDCRDEIDTAIARVIDSGWLILGPELRSFEQEFATEVGVAHAIGVASGTDALILALRALGISHGDVVATVANTAVPTVSAIRATGATPYFIDIQPDTLQISVEALRSAVARTENRIRCIVPVHLHGNAADMDEILSIAAEHKIPVLSDCAQAHGTEVRGRPVGGLGDISCYSFYPTKNLGGLGDGGMCITNSVKLASKLRELRQYGFRDDRTAHSEGVCSRLDELQAAVLRVRLRHFSAAQSRRQAIAQRYLAGLADCPVVLPVCKSGNTHAWHQFVIRARHRDVVCERLKQAGIGFGIHYPCPIHLMPAYALLGHRPGELPHTEKAAQEILSLPMFPGLRDAEVDRILKTVRDATES